MVLPSGAICDSAPGPTAGGCGYNRDSPPGDAIATIRAFPAQLSRLLRIAGVGNDDHQLRTRPAAKTWSPLEYIAHASAAIDWYARRVDRALTEHSPAFGAFD
jgi:hypothetical protein